MHGVHDDVVVGVGWCGCCCSFRRDKHTLNLFVGVAVDDVDFVGDLSFKPWTNLHSIITIIMTMANVD